MSRTARFPGRCSHCGHPRSPEVDGWSPCDAGCDHVSAALRVDGVGQAWPSSALGALPPARRQVVAHHLGRGRRVDARVAWSQSVDGFCGVCVKYGHARQAGSERAARRALEDTEARS